MTKRLRNLQIYITVILLAVVLFITSAYFPIPAKAEETAGTSEPFDTQDLLTELSSSKDKDGNPVKLSDYGYDQSGSLTVFNVVEYCYSFNPENNERFGIYVYLYNPQGLKIMDESGGNSISMATVYNELGKPSRYDVFYLKFCSKTTGDYDGLFYKYKVIDEYVDGKPLYERVDRDKRIYDFGALYLDIGTAETHDIKSYDFGVHCEFTGFAKGYGENAKDESTLNGDIIKNETISLSLGSTFYRPEKEYKDYTQMQLNSVYFSVPNFILEKYGKLSAVHTRWWEYKTRDIVVIADRAVNKTFSIENGVYVSDDVRMYADHFKVWKIQTLKNYLGFDWAFNPEPESASLEWIDDFKKISVWDTILSALGVPQEEHIYSCFDVYSIPLLSLVWGGDKKEDFVISGNLLKSQIETMSNRDKSGFRYKFNGRDLSDRYITDGVDAGRKSGANDVTFTTDQKYDLLVRENQRNGFTTFFLGEKYKETIYDEYKDIDAIYSVFPDQLNGTDEEISKSLLIDKGDVSSFKSSVNNATSKDETTYLLRFGVTDYFSQALKIESASKDLEITNSLGYRAWQTLFYDFNIIDLTFYKDDVYTTIPTVSDPIDIAADVTPPVNFDKEINKNKSVWQKLQDWWDKLVASFGKGWTYIKVGFWVVVGIIAVLLVYKVVRLIVDIIRGK